MCIDTLRRIEMPGRIEMLEKLKWISRKAIDVA
jgi:hypothetical protein